MFHVRVRFLHNGLLVDGILLGSAAKLLDLHFLKINVRIRISYWHVWRWLRRRHRLSRLPESDWTYVPFISIYLDQNIQLLIGNNPQSSPAVTRQSPAFTIESAAISITFEVHLFLFRVLAKWIKTPAYVTAYFSRWFSKMKSKQQNRRKWTKTTRVELVNRAGA